MIIKRVSTGKYGTFGTIHEESFAPFAVTLEREWLNNEIDISCIPAGEYCCHRINSPKHGWTYEVKDVVGRTYIMFHVANLLSELKGCIAIGESFDYLYGKPAILQSGKGFREFMAILEGKVSFPLSIREFF